MWPWQGRAVFPLLLQVANGAGVIDLGRRDPLSALAVLIMIPRDVIEPAIAALLDDGTIEAIDGGFLLPKFVEAQEATKTAALKKRDQRERDRAQARETRTVPVTRSHPQSPAVPLQPSPAQPPAQPNHQPSPAREVARGAPPPVTTAIGWWHEAQTRREAAGLTREKPQGVKLDHWFAEAMLEVNGDEQKLLAGYDAFLADPFWRNEANKRCAWGGWVDQWRDFVTRATAPPVATAKSARAPVDVPDWSTIPAGEVIL
jgi:hypothetical protein